MLALLWGASAPVMGQGQAPKPLLFEVSDAALRMDSAMQAKFDAIQSSDASEVIWKRIITINKTAFEDALKDSVVYVPIADSVCKVNLTYVSVDDDKGIKGAVGEAADIPLISNFLFIISQDGFSGVMRLERPYGYLYMINELDKEHSILVLRRSKITSWECGTGKNTNERNHGIESRSATEGSCSEASPCTVKVLIVYTQASLSNLGNTIQQTKTSAELLINDTYSSSQITNVRISVVGTMKTDYNEGSDAYDLSLNKLRYDGSTFSVYSAMDEVFSARDALGADLVVLLLRTIPLNGVRGIATGLEAAAGNANNAFCVVDAGTLYLDGFTTLAHEIGHNFGAKHDDDLSNDLPYAYGHGYKFSIGSTLYGTIMATGFWQQGTGQNGYVGVGKFSNPNLTYFGVPIGTAADHNVARLHNEMGSVICGYRTKATSGYLNKPITTEGVFYAEATNDIRNDASFLALSGSDVRFEAGSKVTLKTGFRASTGSKFVAKIGTGASASDGLTVAPSAIVAARTATAEADLPEKRTATESISEGSALPTEFSLFQNYPNPFNPTTTIRYALPRSAKVVLVVYDVLGRKAMELVNETKAAGFYEVPLNASRLASGTYFYRLQAGEYVETKKMVVVK